LLSRDILWLMIWSSVRISFVLRYKSSHWVSSISSCKISIKERMKSRFISM
jgi:hypothetical protein